MSLIHSTDPRRMRIARTVLILLLLALGIWVIHGFLAALVWAVVLLVAIDPLFDRIRHIPFCARHRDLTAALCTLGVALVMAVPLAFALGQAAREATDLLRLITEARLHGLPPPRWIASLPFGSGEVLGWWQANLATPGDADHLLHAAGTSTLIAHSQLIGVGVLHRAVIFAFTLLTLFFLIRDRDAIVAQCRAAGAAIIGPDGERIARQALLSVRGTIDGLVLVGIGEGAVMALVYVALGVPHPILLGMATAIAAMIPFGAALLFLVAAALLVAQGAMGGAIAVIVIGLAVVFVADHFIRPALIGGATKLPFLWVLLGILGGVETLGLIGLFVGPATMAVLVMLWRELVDAPVAAADPD